MPSKWFFFAYGQNFFSAFTSQGLKIICFLVKSFHFICGQSCLLFILMTDQPNTNYRIWSENGRISQYIALVKFLSSCTFSFAQNTSDKYTNKIDYLIFELCQNSICDVAHSLNSVKNVKQSVEGRYIYQ